jgi:hypothetical protein
MTEQPEYTEPDDGQDVDGESEVEYDLAEPEEPEVEEIADGSE